MNILVVTPWLPFPPNSSGGHQAIYNGLKAYTKFANVYVTYYAGRKDKSAIYVEDFVNSTTPHIQVFPYVRKGNLYSTYDKMKILWEYKIAKKLFGNDPDFKTDSMMIKNVYPNDYIANVLSLIEKLKIDIVQMEHIGPLPLVINMPPKVKTIFVHHEIGFVVKQLALEGFGYNHYRRIIYEMTKDCEIGLLNRFDRVLTLSDIDAEKLVTAGVKSEKVLSSFGVVTPPSRIDNNYIISKILTFLGPEFHPLDKIGLMWFLENCWEKLKSKDGEYKLHIIGKWSDKTQNEIRTKYKDVIFLGFVDDLSDYLIGTTLIVPITVGSGIRMKILEAVGRKVPFVSTTVGAEGLPFASEKNCFITDNPDEFVTDIIKIQSNKIRRYFVDSAFDIYNNSYTMDALIKQRREICEELLKV